MLRLPLGFLVLVLAAQAAGEDASVAEVTRSTAPVLSPPRAVTPGTAAKIGAGLPKFSPPKTSAEKKTEDQPDLRETDKPQNTIIRLPRYIVREPKAPEFNPRDLLTEEGKLALAYQRYPGLRRLGNSKVARAMLEDDLRLERLREISDLVGLMSFTDPAGARSVWKGATRAFSHSHEWIDGPRGWAGGWAEFKRK